MSRDFMSAARQQFVAHTIHCSFVSVSVATESFVFTFDVHRGQYVFTQAKRKLTFRVKLQAKFQSYTCHL
uniref:Uncharacterized protein n=1 Tax=Anguilla anguilla TaxID=7936 RepID=A0A0E9QHG5_ANGAN